MHNFMLSRAEGLTVNDDGDLICTHPEAYIEKACCSAGTQDCGCKGQDYVICPAENCTGITDSEIEDLFNRLGA